MMTVNLSQEMHDMVTNSPKFCKRPSKSAYMLLRPKSNTQLKDERYFVIINYNLNLLFIKYMFHNTNMPTTKMKFSNKLE